PKNPRRRGDVIDIPRDCDVTYKLSGRTDNVARPEKSEVAVTQGAKDENRRGLSTQQCIPYSLSTLRKKGHTRSTRRSCEKSTHALRTAARAGGIACPEPGRRADRRAAISSHDHSNAGAFTPMGFFVTLNPGVTPFP